MNKKRWIVVVIAFLLVMPLTAQNVFAWNQWDKIVAFGDSLSDNGNADGYGFGVASNGDVWLDYVADELGTELEDRALGGARTYGTYGVGWQVDLYISELSPDVDLSDTLFVVWIGGNDFLAMGEQDDPVLVIGNAINNITVAIQKLIAAGAQNIVVVNLPDIGLAPVYNWDPVVSANASYLAATFNDYLLQTTCGLNQAFPDVRFIMVDTYELMGFVIENSDDFGFTNVTGADGAAVDYDGYLFWDAVHPTTATHQVIAAAAVAKIKFFGFSEETRQIIFKLRPLKPRLPFIFDCIAAAK